VQVWRAVSSPAPVGVWVNRSTSSAAWTGPLRDEFDMGGERSGYASTGMPLKRISSGHDQKRYQHKNQESLPQRGLDNVMDH